MDDNEQKINNNRLVANAQQPPLWLKSINEPVRARPTLCQFLWQLHRREISLHVDFRQSSSHHAVESHELFRIKCPFYDPRPSSHIRSLSLFLPYSDWLHNGPSSTDREREREKEHARLQVTSKSRQDEEGLHIVRRPPKRGSYRTTSCFLRRRGRGT